MSGKQINWKFHEVLIDREHCVSVALDNVTADKISFKMITFEELMKNAIPLFTDDQSFVTQYFAKLDK